MATEKDKSLRDRLLECVKKVRESGAVAAPVVEQVRAGKLDADYLEKIIAFLNGFDEVQEVLNALPMQDGRMPEKLSPMDRKAMEDLMPELISEVEKLAEYQAILTETLRKSLETQSVNLKTVRDAKKVFEKFMKKPEQGPKFFDREG